MVYKALQDRRGFVWVSTENGVSRCDGQIFESFSISDGLPDTEIIFMDEDRKGRIWFLAANGEVAYFLGNRIYNAKIDTSLRKLSPGTGNYKFRFYQNVWEDADWNMWFITNRREVFLLNEEGDLCQAEYGTDTIHLARSNPVLWKGQRMFPCKEGFVTHSAGMLRLHRIPRRAAHYTPERLISMSDSSLVYVNGSSLYRFDGKQETRIWQNPILQTDKNLVLYEDRKQNLWLATSNGAFMLKTTPKRNYRLAYHLLKRTNINHTLQDREGNLWFTSSGDGIYFMPSLLVQNYNINDGLIEPNTNSILILNERNILTGSKNGYINTLWNLNNPNGYFRPFTKTRFKQIYDMVEDSRKRVWIASQPMAYIQHKKVHRLNAEAKCVYEDTNKRIWGGDGKRLFYIKDKKPVYVHTFDDNNRIYSITHHPNGGLCLATDRGLFRWYQDSILAPPADQPLLNKRIQDVKNHEGTVCMAIPGFGAVIYQDSNIVHLDTRTGLPSNLCKRIVFSPTDTLLWIATNKGLASVDYRGIPNIPPAVRVFDSRHGILSDEVNDIAISKDQLWVASSKGISSLNTSQLQANERITLCYISKVKVRKKNRGNESYYKLKSRENDIRIEYVGLCYRCVGKVKYKYRLVGLDSVWQTTYQNFVEFPFLNTGRTYTFQVKAQNEDGVWGMPVSVILEIDQKLYRKSWFIVVLSLLLGGLILLIIQIRAKRRQQESDWLRQISETKRQLAESELKALRAQMNPHFIFNTLNAIQDFILQNDKVSANFYLSKFSRLMRTILEYSKKTYITLEEEIDFLKMYLELGAVCMNYPLDYTLKVDPSIFPSATKVPSMIFQPYIENALRHGLMPKNAPGKLLISLEEKEERLICTIEDNGVGRRNKPGHKRPGYEPSGMKITAERLAIIGQRLGDRLSVEVIDLKDDQEAPLGTRVIVSLPLLEV